MENLEESDSKTNTINPLAVLIYEEAYKGLDQVKSIYLNNNGNSVTFAGLHFTGYLEDLNVEIYALP